MQRNLREQLVKHISGDERLCDYCPMVRAEGPMNTSPHNLCEGRWCGDAMGIYVDEIEEEGTVYEELGIPDPDKCNHRYKKNICIKCGKNIGSTSRTANYKIEKAANQVAMQFMMSYMMGRKKFY